MKVIYEPKGKAREYAPLALNLYNGCTHGCRYCYGRRFNPEGHFLDALPRLDILPKIRKDAADLREKYGDECPEILLSFQGDVYQPAEMELGLTRQAIEILIEHDLPFTVLTKGGIRAERDFDLLEKYPRARFGTTLILFNYGDISYWEPGATDLAERADTILAAKGRGIKTWVSMEPVIIPEDALLIVDVLYPYVDAWKVGKINYHPEIESKVDWIKFREDIKAKFAEYGITDYYLKRSLTDLGRVV